MISLLGPLCAFLSSVTWALGSSTYSRVSRDYSAFRINFTRALIALPCFLLAASFELGSRGMIEAFTSLSTKQWGWLAASIFSSYAFGDILFLWSSESLGVPGALALASIFPIWTALAAFLIQGETLGRLQVLGLLITVAGVVIVILNEPRSPEGRKHPALNPSTRGVLIALVCSICWAVNGYAVAEGVRGVSAFIGNAARMAMALPLCLGVGAVFRDPGPRVLPWSSLRNSLWIFILEAFGGSFFFVYGLSHSRLALASTLTSLAPVLSVPVAILLKIERFSVGRTLGVCLVVFGLCLLVGAG